MTTTKNNKMKKILYLILGIIVLTSSCRNNESEKKRSDIEQNIKIKYLKIIFTIPKSYLLVDNQSTIKELNRFEGKNTLTDAFLQSFRLLKEQKVHFTFLLDSLNMSNQILFTENKEYVDFNKEFVPVYVNMLVTKFNESCQITNSTAKLIENKYISGKDLKIIKTKFEVENNDKRYFSTDYLVTTYNKTFKINILNENKEIDFSDEVKNIIAIRN